MCFGISFCWICHPYSNEQIECDTYTAVVASQIFPNICVAADGSMEGLKNGKQINLAIAYGIPVNYNNVICKLLKLCLDFNNCYEVLESQNKVTLVEGINLIVT